MADDQTPEIACRACGAPAYVCDADHVGGGRYIHCRAASAHSFLIDEEADRG